MSFNWDTGWELSIDNRNGQRILIVEVKSKLNASPEWAARFRRNILAHGTFPTLSEILTNFRHYSQRHLTKESGFDLHFSESDRRGVMRRSGNASCSIESNS